MPKCGIPQHDVHFWVGENANKVFNFFLFWSYKQNFVSMVATKYRLYEESSKLTNLASLTMKIIHIQTLIS